MTAVLAAAAAVYVLGAVFALGALLPGEFQMEDPRYGMAFGIAVLWPCFVTVAIWNRTVAENSKNGDSHV